MESASSPDVDRQQRWISGCRLRHRRIRSNFTSQAVTPLTEEIRARYFFSWGPHCAHGDEVMRDGMMELAAIAFGEGQGHDRSAVLRYRRQLMRRHAHRP